MLNAMLQTYVVDENNDNTAALSSEERQIRQIGSLTAIACAKEEVIHAIVSLLGLPESNVDLVEKVRWWMDDCLWRD